MTSREIHKNSEGKVVRIIHTSIRGRANITYDGDVKVIRLVTPDFVRVEHYHKNLLHRIGKPAITMVFKGVKTRGYWYQGVCIDQPVNCVRESRERTGKIYKLQSTESDELYIGSTIMSMSDRMWSHINGPQFRSQKHFSKLGWNTVTPEILEYFPCNTDIELRVREQWWMDKLQPSLNMIPAVNKTIIDMNAYELKWAEERKVPSVSVDEEICVCQCGGTYERADFWEHYYARLATGYQRQWFLAHRQHNIEWFKLLCDDLTQADYDAAALVDLESLK